jgi:hypothetical protein
MKIAGAERSGDLLGISGAASLHGLKPRRWILHVPFLMAGRALVSDGPSLVGVRHSPRFGATLDAPGAHGLPLLGVARVNCCVQHVSLTNIVPRYRYDGRKFRTAC